jgi:hypothetical protein
MDFIVLDSSQGLCFYDGEYIGHDGEKKLTVL